MNVKDLIEELQKLPPHLTVRGINGLIHFADEIGETDIYPSEEEAQEVVGIRWRGHDVLLECTGICA